MLAIIDGDVLCYQACRSRAYLTEGVNYINLDSNGNRIPLQFTDEEDRKYMDDCWTNFENDLKEMMEITFAEDQLMAVKGAPSFRDLMFPIEFNEDNTKAVRGYKANRWKPGGGNPFVRSLRELAVERGLAIPADGLEADDLLRIWAGQAAESGDSHIICSIDKDLLCIPGKHYLMKHRKIVEVTQQEADLHYYAQLIKGDSTDNIPGVPGIGDKKALKLLENLTTIEQYQEAVVEAYLRYHGEDHWYENLLMNGKLIHLHAKDNDFFSIRNWPIIQELT